MQDYLEDEEKIAKEQDQEPKKICSTILELPISTLDLSPLISVKETESVTKVVSVMQEHSISCVLILGRGGKLKGIFTEQDFLMKVGGKMLNWEKFLVKDIMTKNPVSLKISNPIALAMHHMHIGGYRHVPILDKNDRPIHVVTIRDIISYLIEQFPAEIDNILDYPFDGTRLREGA